MRNRWGMIWHCRIDELSTKCLFAYLEYFTFLNLKRGADLGRSRLVDICIDKHCETWLNTCGAGLRILNIKQTSL